MQKAVHSDSFAFIHACHWRCRITFLGRPGSGVASVHALLDNYYSSLQVKELHGQLYGRVVAAVGRALKKARSKIKAFAQQLEGGAVAGAVQREADIIMANVYRQVHDLHRLVLADLVTICKCHL